MPAPRKGGSVKMSRGAGPMRYPYDQRPMGFGSGQTRQTPNAMTSQDMYASPSTGNLQPLIKQYAKSDPQMAKALRAELAQTSQRGVGFRYGPSYGSEGMPGAVGGHTSGRPRNQTTHKGPTFGMKSGQNYESKPGSTGKHTSGRGKNQLNPSGTKTKYVRFNKKEKGY